MIRPMSSGKQEFEIDPTMFPLGKPMPKLEAVIQCSGIFSILYFEVLAEECSSKTYTSNTTDSELHTTRAY